MNTALTVVGERAWVTIGIAGILASLLVEVYEAL